MPEFGERLKGNNMFNRINKGLIRIIVIGMIIRLVLIPLSFSFDASYWIITGAGFESNRTLYEAGNFYYPPPFGYILAVLTVIWSVLPFGSGILVPELILSLNISSVRYTMITSMAFNSFYMIPLTIFDLITSWLVYSIVMEKTGNKKKANLAFALFFLSPLVIWASSIAYMFDSLSAMFMVLAIYALMKDQYGLAGASLAFATLIKVFPILISFAVILYILSKRETPRSIPKNLGFFICGFIASTVFILLPVFLNGELDQAFQFLSSRVGNSVQVNESSDLIALLLIPTYDKIFVVMPLLFFMMVLSTLLIFLSKGDNDKKLVMASLMSITMFFMFPMTPTYPVVVIPLLALAVTYYGEKFWLMPWILFSALMPIQGIAIFGGRVFYTLALETGLLNLQTLVSNYYSFLPTLHIIRRFTLLALYLPSLSCLVVAVYSFMKPYRRD